MSSARRIRCGAGVAVIVGAAWIALTAAAPAIGALDDLDLVSRSGAGVPGNFGSSNPSISADGRYVAFESFADNLAEVDDDAVLDVFVRDLQTGTTTLVSRRSASEGGEAADGSSSSDPAISADGRFVAFASNAANLSADDNPIAFTDIFVRDLQLQTTTLVSRQSAAEGGAGADDSSSDPAISADGRFVAFATVADNLSTEDAGVRDVFVRDTVAQTTTLASRQSTADGGAAGDGDSFAPAISANGRVVAFASDADNLSTAADPLLTDVFARDLDAGATTFVSRVSGPTGAGGDGSSSRAAISADGRVVGFESSADNLSGDDDDVEDVFVRDLVTDATSLVSRATGPAGLGGDDIAFRATLSADGRYVAFDSLAANLSGADVDPILDVFVRDRSAGTTTLVSRAAGAAGAGGDEFSAEPAISGDGRYVAFESGATNLSAEVVASINVFRRDVLGPPAPTGGGPAITGTAAAAVCRTLPLAPTPTPGDPSDIRLTTGQLLINQRIDQAAIRRANGVQGWLDDGIQGRDLCQGTLGAGELAAGIVTDLAGPSIAFVAPDPRPIAIAAARPADPRGITLSTAQLLINQRISQAAIRRLNALKARMDGGLTGGDVDDGTLAQPAFVSRLRVRVAPPPAAPPAASRTIVAPATPASATGITLSTAQILINQRISQAAVRRANALIARIEDGLLATDVRDGSVTALDLASGVVVP